MKLHPAVWGPWHLPLVQQAAEGGVPARGLCLWSQTDRLTPMGLCHPFPFQGGGRLGAILFLLQKE